MSRGLGTLQREVLEILRRDFERPDGQHARLGGVIACDIAWQIAKRRAGIADYKWIPDGWDMPPAVYKSALRTIATLRRRGLMTTTREPDYHSGFGGWHLRVRLSVDSGVTCQRCQRLSPAMRGR